MGVFANSTRWIVGALASSTLFFGGVAWGFRAAHPDIHREHGDDAKVDPYNGDALAPLPHPPALEPAKVSLGKRLFNDQRLSSDGTVSCASCHVVANGGADSRRFSVGVRGRLGTENAPTVFNVDLNCKHFWDGRASTLEDQAEGPLLNPLEMDETWDDVLTKIRDDGRLEVAFTSAYPSGISRENVKDAIATYERTLVATGSPFDAYLAGDTHALTDQQREGYALFEKIGCASCHQGRNVGGNMFEKIGIMDDYFAARGGPITQEDLGRFNVTHDPDDKFTFRVPSLRLASRTAPYFHDGSIATLDQAIFAMGRYQLGEELDAHEVAAIASFIDSLAGNVEDR